MGYIDTGSLWRSIGVSAALDLSLAFIWAHESYRARSLWPAVFFHSFPNTISQWLFPKFFMGGDNERWLGEGGHLPLAGYIVVGVALMTGVWNAVQARDTRGHCYEHQPRPGGAAGTRARRSLHRGP